MPGFDIRRIQFVARVLLALCCVGLTGCLGGSGVGGGGLLGGGGIRPVAGGNGGLGPLAPGTGSGGPDQTANLGGANGGNWGQTGQNPPQMGPLAPGSGNVSFDGNTQAVLAKYNARIAGEQITPERVQRITTALQLYKTRQHPLTVMVYPDPSKLPEAARWTSDGSTAIIYVWQPDLQHTIDHEMAHDLTLMAYPDAGNQMQGHIQQLAGDSGTWPSDYAQTNTVEGMAEIVSFLAAIWARLPIDEQPFQSFNPQQALRQDARAFMSDQVAANAR